MTKPLRMLARPDPAGISRVKEQFGAFDGVILTGDVELGTKRHTAMVFTLDDCSGLPGSA